MTWHKIRTRKGERERDGRNRYQWDLKGHSQVQVERYPSKSEKHYHTRVIL
jgi:hypothetical protein